MEIRKFLQIGFLLLVVAERETEAQSTTNPAASAETPTTATIADTAKPPTVTSTATAASTVTTAFTPIVTTVSAATIPDEATVSSTNSTTTQNETTTKASEESTTFEAKTPDAKTAGENDTVTPTVANSEENTTFGAKTDGANDNVTSTAANTASATETTVASATAPTSDFMEGSGSGTPSSTSAEPVTNASNLTTSITPPTTTAATTTYVSTATPIDTTASPTAQPPTTVATTQKTTTPKATTAPVVVITTKETTAPTTTTTKRSTTAAPRIDNTILAVCLTFFILVLIIFIIVLYFYCTGKDLPFFGKGRRGAEIIPDGMPMRKPSSGPKYAVGHMFINEEDFEVQFKRKIADDGRGFREEYRAVQTEGGTMAVAKDPVNIPKNRYDNVLPWDSTRVVLSTPPGGEPTDDYINANYVPGYLQEKKFIACQGPKENTCADFWKMMWDQKCATIVMVTNVIEAKKPKCHQYWPGDDSGDGATAKYGNFVVNVADVKIRNFFVMRTLKLQLFDYPPRMIRQLHYVAWPDFGVPKNPHELLLFRRRVIAANPPHSGPIVVHCSAGVGRTGTYILIDAGLEQLQAEGKVDLFSFLTKMRKSRMMLVQTDAQYTFAHAAVLEHIKYGETEVPVKKFRTQVQSLREPLEDSEESLLDQQFSTLLKVQLNKENMKHGRQSIKKNRVLQIIPYDDNRVTLPLKPGQEKSDYINASFIDGFKTKRAYIATQGPLGETADDFWMMVWVYQVQNIVMLTELMEKGHEMCCRYWPEDVNEEQTFGDITVKFVSKDDDDVVDYTVREFVLTNSGASDEDEERKVRQFHYHGWPEVGLPTDSHGMIEIANRLTPKDKDGYPRPTVVHCSSGGGRTGVFISLTILMEQADSEGMVDVFQTAKCLRAQRPHIIQTQEQFYFCYAALLQYLETNQMAEDSTTLTSNLNSSIGNHSQSVTPSNGGGMISPHTPQGSMNNKLDCNSVNDPDSVTVEIKVPDDDAVDLPPPPEPESPKANGDAVVTIETQSSETASGDSVNQALLKQPATSDGEDTNGSSNSDFEVVNEVDQETAVKV